MVFFKVRGGHDHNVRLQLHHQGDQPGFIHIVGMDFGFTFLEDGIVGVFGHIMDDDIRFPQKRLDNILKIFVVAAALRIENQPHILLVFRRKKLLTFPRCVSWQTSLVSDRRSETKRAAGSLSLFSKFPLQTSPSKKRIEENPKANWRVSLPFPRLSGDTASGYSKSKTSRPFLTHSAGTSNSIDCSVEMIS